MAESSRVTTDQENKNINDQDQDRNPASATGGESVDEKTNDTGDAPTNDTGDAPTNDTKTSHESVDGIVDAVEDDAMEKMKLAIVGAVIGVIILLPCVCKFCCNTWYYRRCGPPELCRPCCGCCGFVNCCYEEDPEKGNCNDCALNCCNPDGKCGGWGCLC